MKKKITLKPIIAIVLVLAIAAGAYCFTNHHNRKSDRDRLTETFELEFYNLTTFFPHVYENVPENERSLIFAEVSAHSYYCLWTLSYTSYATNIDLSDVLLKIYNLTRSGKVFEAINEDIAMDMEELSHDLNNRELAQIIKFSLSKYD